MEDQLKTLFIQVLADLAKMYDLPELKTARIASQSSKAGHSYAVDVEVEPRGHMAGIARSLRVEVSMSANRNAHGYIVELSYAYHHHSGGSNGYTTRFICLVRRDHINDKDEYTATVLERVVQTVSSVCYDLVRSNCKGKTAEQIMEMYGDKL